MTTPLAARPAAQLGPEVVAALADASPSWLAERRRAAWDAYTALPMPSSARDEDWRRTDISGLRIDEYSLLDSVDASVVGAMRRQRNQAAPEAAFAIDAPGVYQVVENADALLAQGVIVTTLEEAATRHPELARRALTSVPADAGKFTALWNALWRGGVFVHVPAGVEALTPVWIAHPAAGEGGMFFPTTVIQVDDGASLTVIDATSSPAGSAEMFSNAVTVLRAGRDARLDFCQLQQLGHGVWHVATDRATLDSGAALRFFGVTLGARLQKAYWEAFLDGRGAEADLYGICLGSEHQHHDHQSLQAHRAPETRSRLLLKTAVRDQARSVYGGLIDVAPEAVHADGYVENRNLLLSRGAKADSVPRLEIRANDVRCGHGATAGHIDQEERFYLMARGIPREQADSLIVRGFMDAVVDRIPHAGLAALVGEILDQEITGQLPEDAET